MGVGRVMELNVDCVGELNWSVRRFGISQELIRIYAGVCT